MNRPKGIGLYVRALASTDSPARLAKSFKDHHLHWVAFAGPWHDKKGRRFINRPATCKRYIETFETAGIRTYVWGYPWQGTEDAFLDDMEACAASQRWLLDPELGINPSRAKSGALWDKAVACGKKLVIGAKAKATEVGMSSYGIPPSWFPLSAFAQCDWAGGQTYTKNELVAKSVRLFRAKFPVVTPNFGLYTEAQSDTDGKRKVRSKTPAELDAHLQFFLDAIVAEAAAQGGAGETPAMIGWAENFMKPGLWTVLARFAERLEAL